MACFWPTFKDGLEEKHLTCLLLEVHSQNNLFLQGNRLAALFGGWSLQDNTLNIKLRETAYDQIFTQFKFRYLVGMSPTEADEEMDSSEVAVWIKCRKLIARNLRKSPASQPVMFKWFQSKSM